MRVSAGTYLGDSGEQTFAGAMEGVRYESLRGLAMTGQQYFGGIFH